MTQRIQKKNHQFPDDFIEHLATVYLTVRRAEALTSA